ncbi:MULTISPECIES: DUF1517 domain-containing protein [unclassified Leptolyngbya]|uniref:DUF1517 domain-containing protein n=1 Tax=unclassified Leptolyngbya TaxID=2650499 RepID=UPI0016886FB1|nr:MULTISPECIES: DUF1517 domain-containing protein [unclassified Leptolyngbya]MBD1912141.1 DUF1517 domain-containing protein [Leptolyngbya sp. FACHB-8]MBD2155032.1 DUF1517 domain-containing protein [Leptolyngbya sp. FACHB-16]
MGRLQRAGTKGWIRTGAIALLSLGILGVGDIALSTTSGGRTRGGGFDSAPPAGGGGTLPPSDYRPSSPPSGWNYPSDYSPYEEPYGRPYRRYPSGPVIVPVPGGGYGSGPVIPGPSSSGLDFIFLLFFLGFGVLPIIMTYLKLASSRRGPASHGYGSASGELHNDRVTVTQLQVALLAQARYIQDTLNQIAEQGNLNTKEGLVQALRETVLVLLRSPENWTHVLSQSQSVDSRAHASQLFEQLSLEERSKFDVESLVNVGGRVQRRDRLHREEDPASYIVVTLLVGSTDDRPLISGPIYNSDDLRTALKRLGSISPESLLIYEVLWSPQDPSDSLTRDELLTNYSGMVQI